MSIRVFYTRPPPARQLRREISQAMTKKSAEEQKPQVRSRRRHGVYQVIFSNNVLLDQGKRSG
jgi:hypothetical protein